MTQVRRSEAVRGYTRYERWNVICRCAMILGVINNGHDKGDCLKVHALLEKRMRAGKVKKKKNGRSQSSPAFYAAKLPQRRR